ncbi:MAG: polysaccharide biosynthesis tyrosine autokinase [Phycisphaerales bacterium]|nr:polysaccharide biosynthesis tyrosine autokinase [Phycisphaerales bacterium]
MQQDKSLTISTGKNSDVLTISYQSHYPDEAALLVNSLVEAYIAEGSNQSRNSSTQLITTLRGEKQQLQQDLDQSLRGMLKFKRDNKVLSFRDDKGNIGLERTATLSASLTEAEIATIGLQAQKTGIEKALENPRDMRDWVEAQQFKGRDFGDQEYDDLRKQLSEAVLAHASAITIQGEKHRSIQILEARIAAIRQRLDEKEQSIARAHLVQLQSELTAAQQKEDQLRQTLVQQRDRTLDMGDDSIAYENLEAAAAQTRQQIQVIDARIGELSANRANLQPLNVQILQSARVETNPVRPQKALVLLISLMMGCLGGLGLVVAREWQDVRLRQPEEIPVMLGTPVVSVVPRINPRLSPIARGQIAHMDARSPVAEAYRSIRTSLRLGPAAQARTILVTSPSSGDGKSTSASNLAIAFAQTDERTLLIDCDLREPVQHMIFETSSEQGVSTLMAGECSIEEAICPTRVPNLSLLPCGPIPQSPAELLASDRFNQLMEALCARYDRIIIDSPPLTCVTDGRILAASADATLLVLRLNLSVRKRGIEAMDMLDKISANVVGAIANDATPSRGYQYYGRAWTYASAARRVLPAASFDEEPSANRADATETAGVVSEQRHRAATLLPTADSSRAEPPPVWNKPGGTSRARS